MLAATVYAAIEKHANIQMQVPTRTGTHYVQIDKETAFGFVTAAGDHELDCCPLHGILYIMPAMEAPRKFEDGQHTSFGDLPVGSTFRFLPAGTYSYTKTTSTSAKRPGRPDQDVAGDRAVAYVG
jgi:hypothetical protein